MDRTGGITSIRIITPQDRAISLKERVETLQRAGNMSGNLVDLLSGTERPVSDLPPTVKPLAQVLIASGTKVSSISVDDLGLPVALSIDTDAKTDLDRLRRDIAIATMLTLSDELATIGDLKSFSLALKPDAQEIVSDLRVYRIGENVKKLILEADVPL